MKALRGLQIIVCIEDLLASFPKLKPRTKKLHLQRYFVSFLTNRVRFVGSDFYDDWKVHIPLAV